MILSLRKKKSSDVGGKQKFLASLMFRKEHLVVACALENALLNKIMEMALLLRKFLQVVKK